MPLTNVDDNSAKVINITQNSAGAYNQFDLAGLPIAPAAIDQDLYIEADIVNEDGNVRIENVEGSIFVNGEIRAASVEIIAGKDLNLNSDAWFHTNRDPRQYLNYDKFRGELFDAANLLRGTDVWANLPPSLKRTVKADGNFEDATGLSLNEAIAEDSSRILAQARSLLPPAF